MIRDQQTLTLLLKTIARFVRDRLVPNEQWVEDNDRMDEVRPGARGLKLGSRFDRVDR